MVTVTFETASGGKAVQTTFSADQVVHNYANHQVLLEIIDLLLFYASQGYGDSQHTGG